MIDNTNLEAYLPEFMQEYVEPVAALKAINPEFDTAWDEIERTLNNRFISTADEYGISRFEKMLGIYPESNDTLESRRVRVRNKWFNQVPYTIKALIQKLTVLSGDADFTLTNNFDTGYTLSFETNLELYGQVDELKNLMNTVLPCNIVVESKNNIRCDVEGDAILGGGACSVNQFTVAAEDQIEFADM